MKSVEKFLLLFITSTTVLLHACSNTSNDNTKYGSNEKVGKYIKTRGLKIYFETYGEGEPLLIIHPNGGSIKSFLYQIPYFSKTYKVILADSRAQGKSEDNGDSLSYEMMADDLNALLDSLHIDSCYVIGWSDGGINGLLLAMRHPDKVKKLAVSGANLWADTTAVDPFIFQRTMVQKDSVDKLPRTPENINRQKLMRLLANEPNIPIEQLQMIKCPTLVIGGDHDVLRPKHTLLIAEGIPNSYLWVIPNSGHATPIYHKNIFNDGVSNFFKTPYRKIEGLARFR